MLKIGHRGACGYKPENTILSFSTAVDLGADAIEFDIRLTKDGNLVVIHDETVDRTTNGKGPVREYTLKELQRLNAGEGEQIPTLEKVFETFGNRIIYNIEIKEAGLRKKLLDIIKEYNLENSVIISSFPEHWIDVVFLSLYFKTGLLAKNRHWSEVALAMAARQSVLYSLHIPARILDEKFLLSARKCTKCKVFVWTCNEISEIEKFKKMGVDGIFSDYPDRL